MKGKRQIVLNQATLMEIVEEWMNEQNYAGGNVICTGVAFNNSESTATFTVEPEGEAI